MIFTSGISVLHCHEGHRVEQCGCLALTTCGFCDLTIYKAEVGLIGLQKSNEEILCT